MVRVLPRYDGQRVTAEDEDDFFNEVDILSRLDHVNIIRLIGYVVASRPFLIVTHLQTVSCLRDYLLHASTTSSDAAARSPLLQLCRQMTSAVAYLAARRYSYRCMPGIQTDVQYDRIVKVIRQNQMPLFLCTPCTCA